jgi:hypothetical protein
MHAYWPLRWARRETVEAVTGSAGVEMQTW